MKKIMNGILATIIAVGFAACEKAEQSKFPGYDEVESGLFVQYLTKNEEGRTVVPGDILTMYMKYTTEDDSILFESTQDPRPVQMKVDTGKFEGDFMGVFIGMNEGDSVSVMVNADTFYLKSAGYPEVPKFIDSASFLKFTIALHTVESLEEMQARRVEEQKVEFDKEKEILAQYLSDNNITTEPTASGLIFIPGSAGSGAAAEAGKRVSVNYKGYLLDGTYFDTSDEEAAKANGVYNPNRNYEPYSFTLGNREVIPGWDEGIAMMSEGGTATLIVPSSLAYGANPRPGGVIQPFNTLIFEVELVGVE